MCLVRGVCCLRGGEDGDAWRITQWTFLRLFQINNQQGEIVEEKERKDDHIYIYISIYSSIYLTKYTLPGILDLSYKVHPLVNEPYSPLVDECLL